MRHLGSAPFPGGGDAEHAGRLEVVDEVAGEAAGGGDLGAASTDLGEERVDCSPTPTLARDPPPRRIPIPHGWVVDGVATELLANELVRAETFDPTRDHSAISRLSPSEKTVARLVAAGLTNREIGAELHISRRTVETHIAYAFQKLNIRTRSSLATLMTSAPDY